MKVLALSRSFIVFVFLLGTVSAFGTTGHSTESIDSVYRPRFVTGRGGNGVLGTPEGQFFSQIHSMASPSDHKVLPAFQAERTQRSSDPDPFMAEGEIYAAFDQRLKSSWSSSDLQSSYLSERLGLENLESSAETHADKEFLFHAEKALMLVGFQRRLFSRTQYLSLFENLRARLQQ